MKKLWPLLALGLLAYLAFVIVTFPASVVTSRLTPLGIYLGGVEGTAWKGRAQVLQVEKTSLGSLTWDLHGLPLLRGRLVADVKLARPDGFAQSQVTATLGRQLELRDLSASLPLSAFPLAAGVAGGWSGGLKLKFNEIVMRNGWPLSVDGRLELMDLTGPTRNPSNMGSYKISFAPGLKETESLVGALTDLGGPLDVAATVQLKPDRSFLVDGLVATRGEAPEQLARSLQILGSPDAQGRRPFSLSGTM
jgi:general secretion pathway protein N